MAAKLSFKTVIRTPQANDDTFGVGEDTLTYLDVLDNDLGGAAKSLYSLSDSTTGQYDATLGQVVSIETLLGAEAAIVFTGDNAGTISYDASSFDTLAEGETARDTFTYIIRLGNGTLSIATVTVTITGTNDRPVVADVTVGGDVGVAEDGPVYRGGFLGDDIDSDDDLTSLTYQILSEPDEGSVTIDPDNSAGFIFDPGADFQDLEEGETRTVTFPTRRSIGMGQCQSPRPSRSPSPERLMARAVQPSTGTSPTPWCSGTAITTMSGITKPSPMPTPTASMTMAMPIPTKTVMASSAPNLPR
jgi:VCBS repeat-containing protein